MTHARLFRLRYSGFLLFAVSLALGTLWSRPARAAAKWTEVVVAEGAYSEMDDRFKRVGASDQVNVVVLHSDGTNALRAYQVLKDTVSTHTPGECCPGVTSGTTGCCGLKEISLSDIGISNGKIDLAMIEKFWAFVQAKYSAEHYILTLRGQPNMGVSQIYESGFTVADLAAATGRFVAAQGGRKVDIVNIAFCLSGSVDWSYAFNKVADYYVGPPNWTNSPVAARWRVHRWAQELVKNPALGSREMATKMVDIFTEDGNECSAGCTNLSIGEPWTCGAEDMSQAHDYAMAMRDFACAYLQNYDSTRDKPLWDAAKAKTVSYGATNQFYVEVEHYDIKQFAMNLKDSITDATVKDKLTKFIDMHDKYAFKHVLEPTGFSSLGGVSYGLSSYFNILNGAVYSTPEKIGPWMTDSLWKLLLAKVSGVSVVTTVANLVVDGSTTVAAGSSIDLTARGANTSFPSGLCPTTNVTWQVDNSSVATLAAANANPAKLTGVSAGQVKVTATSAGKSGSITITVTGSDSGTGGTMGPGGTTGGGGMAGSGGSSGKGGVPGSGGAGARGGAVGSGGSSNAGSGGSASTGSGGSKTGGNAGSAARGGAGRAASGGAAGGGGTAHDSSGKGGSSSIHPTNDGSKGCACRMGGVSSDRGWIGTLLLVGMLVAGLRRRGKHRVG